MDVVGPVGAAMVMTVRFGPPENAALDGERREQREQELDDARCLERTMREIAMIADAESEAAYKVAHGAQRDALPSDARPDDTQTKQMQKDVGDENVNAETRTAECG
jgi:hypothetical protein